MGIFRVGIVRVRVILGGNFLWWGFFGWEFSGGNHAGGNFPGGSLSRTETFYVLGLMQECQTFCIHASFFTSHKQNSYLHSIIFNVVSCFKYQSCLKKTDMHAVR